MFHVVVCVYTSFISGTDYYLDMPYLSYTFIVLWAHELVIMNIELEPSFVDRCLHFSSVECNSGVHNSLCLVVGETD